MMQWTQGLKVYDFVPVLRNKVEKAFKIMWVIYGTPLNKELEFKWGL